MWKGIMYYQCSTVRVGLGPKEGSRYSAPVNSLQQLIQHHLKIVVTYQCHLLTTDTSLEECHDYLCGTAGLI